MNHKLAVGDRRKLGGTDDWITPTEILDHLGNFDLDPCCPSRMPWQTALEMWCDFGLSNPWFGRVWLNPPYSNVGDWIRKLSNHKKGIALIFARTETKMFHELVWNRATAMLFLRGRIYFRLPNGQPARGNAGGPSVLIAYDESNAEVLRYCNLPGYFVRLR